MRQGSVEVQCGILVHQQPLFCLFVLHYPHKLFSHCHNTVEENGNSNARLQTAIQIDVVGATVS